MKWHVLSDFDGTISIDDTTDLLLEHFADDIWQEIEAEWEQGLIGSAECMGRQIDLLRCDKAELDALIATISIDPAFLDFITRCREYDVPVKITSDGLDYVIHHVLQRHGLDDIPIIANKLIFAGPGRYRFETPYSVSTCTTRSGVCKCQIAEETAASDVQILYIGDGRSDYCVALEKANLVLAKKSLLTYCQQNEIVHQSIEDFREATEILSVLTAVQ